VVNKPPDLSTGDLSIGDRIRIFRERRGKSQAALGGLVGRSEDWVSKVERNVIPIDRLSMLLEIARVLKVRDLTELTGHNLALAPNGSPEHPSVPAIRAALASLPSTLGRDQEDQLSPAELSQRVDALWHSYENDIDRYTIVGPAIPELLCRAHRTVRQGAGTDSAVRSLAEIYHLLQIYLRRVGEPTLARVAADRALNLAAQSDDPSLISASAWNMCSALNSNGQAKEARDLALTTMSMYKPSPEAEIEHVSAYGALHLSAAISCVRVGNGAQAWDLLHQATEVGRRTGDRNDWRTWFGPTNVAMHGVHLAAEEGDAAEALRLSQQIDVRHRLSLTRRTRYLVELVNAYRQRKDDMGVLFTLGQIERQSPEEIKFYPLVREAVRDLLRRERPTYRDEVRGIAHRIGVLA
jgi:transcriptional regulator with XRE-family HTH domain